MKLELPEKAQNTGMLTLNTMFNSVGRTAGALAGGFFLVHGELFGYRGGKALYTLSALLTSAVVAVHLLTNLLLRICGEPTLLTPTSMGSRGKAVAGSTTVTPLDGSQIREESNSAIQ